MICTRNRPEELEQCLESVFRLLHPQYEVLVVDNAPADARTRAVAERWQVRYVLEPAPGLSRARNRGVRSCQTDLVAFLDDDARPEPDWLAELAREFDDPAVMAVVGRTLGLRVETEAQQLFQRLGGYDRGLDTRRVIDSRTPSWFELANFGGIGSGVNMAFRRQAFELWPGFDCRLGRGAVVEGNEEHHAFFSLINRGYRVVYTPAAVMRHPFPDTWEEFRKQQLQTLGCGFGYLAFLFREEPRYRRHLLRFTVDRVHKKILNWRHAPAEYRRLVSLRRQVPVMLWSALRSLVAGKNGVNGNPLLLAGRSTQVIPPRLPGTQGGSEHGRKLAQS